MRKHRLILLLIACTVICTISIFLNGCVKNPSAASLAAGAEKYSDLTAKLDAFMTAYNDNCSYKYIGTILVARGGEILLNKGYGMADYEKNIPNKPDTVFGIGSVSKSFTAAAILQLQEKGLLNVNDPISKYIDGNPRGDDITIHQLLTHTSGLPRDGLRFGAVDVPFAKNISFINAARLLFEPGKGFSYSNEGYIMLAAIIEKVSGKPYNDYIKDNILKPLKMRDSRLGTDNSYASNQAAAYEILTGAPRQVPLASFSYATGCGNIYSTAEDLFKYDRALYSEKLISRKSLDKMFTSYSDGNYGYGWGIGQRFGRREISHNGHIEGYFASLIRFPDDDIVLIFLSNNNNDTAFNQVSGTLPAIVLGQDYIMPEKINTVEVNPGILKKYTGKYSFKEGFTVTMEYADGKLIQKEDGGNSYELLPISETDFYPKNYECSRAKFIMDQNGDVVGVMVSGTGSIFEGKKVE